MLWEVRSAAAAFPTFSSSHHQWAVCSREDGHPLMLQSPSSHSRQLPGEQCWESQFQSGEHGKRQQLTEGWLHFPCAAAFESSVLPEGSAGDGTAWCGSNDLESGGPKHSAGCIASMLAVLRGLWKMLRCKTAAIWLQAIFSLFILCWCVMCSSVENFVSPKRRFELESRQGKHHLSRNHFS